MSGGSCNYLYSKDVGEDNYFSDLNYILTNIAYHYKNAKGCATFVQKVELLKEKYKEAQALHDELRSVLHDYEWYKSGDYSEDQFLKSLAKVEAKE